MTSLPLGLAGPFVTDPDPDRVQEGSIDPLGLANLSERLAEELVPSVTARMSRIRMVTVIAVASSVLREPLAFTTTDGTPAYLPFEWIVVEGFARRPPKTDTRAIPGLGKAQRRLRVNTRHLDSTSYLQTPKVFGIHGVYKRLAREFGLVDQDLVLLENGIKLLEAWEQTSPELSGFVRRVPGSPGSRFASRLQSEVRSAAAAGAVSVPLNSMLWGQISSTMAPAEAGRRERRLLSSWLSADALPERTEMIELLRGVDEERLGERQIVERASASSPSAALAARLGAIDAFESAVRLVDDAFQLLRTAASDRRPKPMRFEELSENETLSRCAAALPGAVERARKSLAPLSHEFELDKALGRFSAGFSPEGLAEEILSRHDEVQAAKGKRPWFEVDDRGFVVRSIGERFEPFVPRTEYLHPYRIFALRSFIRDLSGRGAK